jgi:hypothetical protein
MTKLLETLSRATPAFAGFLWSEKENHAEVTREEISQLFASELKDAERAVLPETEEV